MVHYISQHKLKIEEYGHFDHLRQTLLCKVYVLTISLAFLRSVASAFYVGRVLIRSHDHFIYGSQRVIVTCISPVVPCRVPWHAVGIPMGKPGATTLSS